MIRLPATTPAPCVAKPERRQEMQCRSLRSAVGYCNTNQDVVGVRLGVLRFDIEATTVVEHSRVGDLELPIIQTTVTIPIDELRVRKGSLRILVQCPHVRVGRRGIDVVVTFLDVFAVISLGTGESEQSLLENRVVAIPQRDRET